MRTALLLVLLAGCGSVTASSSDAGLEAGNTGAAGAAADAALEHGNTGAAGGPAGSSGAAGATVDAGPEHPTTLAACAGELAPPPKGYTTGPGSCDDCASLVPNTIMDPQSAAGGCRVTIGCIAAGGEPSTCYTQADTDGAHTVSRCVKALLANICPGVSS